MNIRIKIDDALNHIRMGVDEIVAGTKIGDTDMVNWGYAAINDSLLALDELRQNDSDALMDLHRAAADMWDVFSRHDIPDGACREFLAARERHQIALSKLAGGQS